MLKLLLEQDREQIQKEYYVRVATLVLLFASAIAFVWGIVLIATHIQVRVGEKIITEQIQGSALSNVLAKKTAAREAAIAVAGQVELLQDKPIHPSLFIDAVNGGRPENVSVYSIRVDLGDVYGVTGADNGDADTKTVSITIEGFAETRADLLAFQSNLQKQELFTVVDIPYSSFARNEDISFTANIESVDVTNLLEHEL